MLVDFSPAFAGFAVIASGAAQVDGELAHFGWRVRFFGVAEELFDDLVGLVGAVLFEEGHTVGGVLRKAVNPVEKGVAGGG